MFKFFKEKLGKALASITKKIETEIPDEETELIEEVVIKEKKPRKKRESKPQQEKNEEPQTITPQPAELAPSTEVKPSQQEPEEKQGFFSKLFKKKKESPTAEQEPLEKEPEFQVKPVDIEEVEEVATKGLFGKIKEKITTKKISQEKFEEIFFDLEVILLENNVAYEVIEKIKQELSRNLTNTPIKRGTILATIQHHLKSSIEQLFNVQQRNLIQEIKNKKNKPYIITFVGVNGSGKTTTIAKLAHHLTRQGITCLLVAGDTWRAASIQQLEEHGKKLGLKVIKHDYGSDPAAVAYDGIASAKSKNIDCVLIDTAGRQHSNKDLMREMEKIVRVTHPDFTFFIGESITGNDCVQQAQQFSTTIPIDGIILTKADVDEKGGAAISIGYVTGKPIMYLGKGQNYEDLEAFNPGTITASLGL